MNSSTDTLLEALRSLSPTIVPEFEYRVYYDPITKICEYKNTSIDSGNFVTVTRNEYESIEFCPNYFVTSDGKIKRRQLDFTQVKTLQLSSGGYRTLKDNNIFVVPIGWNGESDHWELRINHE